MADKPDDRKKGGGKQKGDDKRKGDDKPLVRRGKDDYEFLDSRAESTPLDRGAVDAHLSGLRSRVLTRRRNRGREAHELGTTLNTLYMRHADAVLGKPDFDALLVEQWQDDTDEAKGCMIVAKVLTVDQAEEHGYWKSLYGVRIMKKLGIVTFETLEKRRFDVERGKGIAFGDLTVAETKELAGVNVRKAPELPEPVGRVVLRLRARARALQESREEYEALDVRIFSSNGKPAVTITSTGREGAEVARRFLAELWKQG